MKKQKPASQASKDHGGSADADDAVAELIIANEELAFQNEEKGNRAAELKQSKAQLQLLLDSTAEAIYGLDTHGNCTFCNSACLQMLGYEREDELLGKNMHCQIHHKHANGTRFPVEECRIFRAFQANEGSHVDDEVLWRADGTSFPAEYWSYPQRIDGAAVGAVVTFIDITERRLAEAALRASEDKYRGLFESSRDAIMTLEPPTWHFTSGNPATLKMFGLENEQAFVSLGPWNLAPERQPNGQLSADLAKEMIGTAMREGSHFFEWTHRRLSGEAFPATVLLSRMHSAGKEFLQATVRDITELKRAEGVVIQNVVRAEELTRLKSRFVSMASHELRTPLANIMLDSDLLKNFGNVMTGEQSQSVLAGLMTGVISMVRTLDDLLLAGKLEEGKLPFTPTRFPLLDFLRRGCLEIEPVSNVPSRIAITFLDAGLDITADERLLHHILINLLENALKYSPDGTKVELGVETGPDSLTLSVLDRGIGVPEAERRFLFDAFSRASNVGDKPGSGLGLFLAQKCSQAHGGQMRYTSLPDGSAFSVTIPLAAPTGGNPGT